MTVLILLFAMGFDLWCIIRQSTTFCGHGPVTQLHWLPSAKSASKLREFIMTRLRFSKAPA